MNKNTCTLSLVLLLFLLSHCFCPGNAQINSSGKLFFISDCQEPGKMEKLYLNAYRNVEARDSLFKDLLVHRPDYVFMLGDIVTTGSSSKSWTPVDVFLSALRGTKAKTYAVPGNHEYYVKPSLGIKKYRKRFPQLPVLGYCVRTDSMAIVMLNSNFNNITALEMKKQQDWYVSTMDSLDNDDGIKAIFVCTHHSPYSNSKTAGSSKPVIQFFVPRFEQSSKSKLFITGHSHNLEHFKTSSGKHYLVIGGGGGLIQPLYPLAESRYLDLLKQENKPLYFYVIIERNGNDYNIKARGLTKNFDSVQDFDIGRIE